MTRDYDVTIKRPKRSKPKPKEFKYRTTVMVRVPMHSTRCLPYLPLPQNVPFHQGAVVDVIVKPTARKKAVKKVG